MVSDKNLCLLEYDQCNLDSSRYYITYIMNECYWEHFEHEADIGVRGIADTLAGAFEQAAIAMTAVITDPDTIQAVTRVEIECEAPDRELLLADWLNALIYEMATRKMLFCRFNVTIDHNHLSGQAYGEKIDRRKHRPVVEIKGATYTALNVRQDQVGLWYAQCVVDV